MAEPAPGADPAAPQPRKPDPTMLQAMDIVKKYFALLPLAKKAVFRDILLAPDETIASEIAKPDLGGNFLEMMKAALIYAVIATCVLFIVVGFYALVMAVFTLGFSLALLVFPVVMFFLILTGTALGWLIITTLSFVFAKLLGGKAELSSQLSLFAVIQSAMLLALLPISLFSAIPCIGWIANLLMLLFAIYMLYVQYKAVKQLHQLESTKAIAVVLLPPVLLVLLIVLLFIVAFFAPFLIAAFFTFGAVGGGPVPVPGNSS